MKSLNYVYNGTVILYFVCFSENTPVRSFLSLGLFVLVFIIFSVSVFLVLVDIEVRIDHVLFHIVLFELELNVLFALDGVRFLLYRRKMMINKTK
jgi:hypothetical protein